MPNCLSRQPITAVYLLGRVVELHAEARRQAERHLRRTQAEWERYPAERGAWLTESVAAAQRALEDSHKVGIECDVAALLGRSPARGERTLVRELLAKLASDRAVVITKRQGTTFIRPRF